MEFTGEFFLPGKSGKRIEEDHMERYLFACNFANGKSILDIACGAGYSAPLFINSGASKYTGVDLNKALIKCANETYGSEFINYSEGNICTFKNNIKFDLITCFETIEHLHDYKTALCNLFSLLNKGGTLLISSPNRPITSPLALSISDKPSNKFHTQEFTPQELLISLRNAGFYADKSNLFGQRQRINTSNAFVRKIMTRLFGNPDSHTSPKVTPVTFKTPRYFIVVAKKP